MKREADIKQVQDWLAWWAFLVKSRSCQGLTDVNRISEGLAKRLLNEFFSLQLEDLNLENPNVPGIDLGDRVNGVAYQVSSQADNQKILESLERIREEDRQLYHQGIRFFFISLEKPTGDTEKIRRIMPSFDPAMGIMNVPDLQRKASRLYDDDPERFRLIGRILRESLAPWEKEMSLHRLEELPLDSIPPVAPSLPAGSRMPFGPNYLFVGREADLLKLAAVLKGGETAAIGQIAAASGMGGIGKTQLAVEFVHRYGQYFAGVFWLNFGGEQDIPAEIAVCGGPGHLELFQANDPLEPEERCRRVYTRWQNGLPYLLVFDNCEEEELLARYRPSSGYCRVLVTSRNEVWSREFGIRQVPVGVLSLMESVELLQKLCPGLPVNVAEVIAGELGCLPLALYLAGSYLEEYQGMVSPVQYLMELRSPSVLDHAAFTREEKEKLTGHDLHVARTFSLSLNRLNAADPVDREARRALAASACLAPGALIPRLLLIAILEGETEGDAGRRLVIRAIKRLRQTGLLKEQADGSLLLHRLLAVFARTLIDDEVRDQMEDGLGRYSHRILESGLPGDFLPLEAHLREAGEVADRRKSKNASGLYSNLAQNYYRMARFAEAEPLMRRALEISENRYGKNHLDVAIYQSNLAQLLKDTNRIRDAEPLLIRALEISERNFGLDHPYTGTALNNYARMLQDSNRLQEAEPRMRKVIGIFEKYYGKRDSKVAVALSNLARLLQDMKQLQEAERLMKQALFINKSIKGMDHPDVARDMNNLAGLLQSTNRLQKAEYLYRKALMIDEKHFGSNHPKVAIRLNNLAQVLNATNRFGEAEQHMWRVLDIFTMAYGPDHPDVAMALNNLAQLLHDTGRFAEAEPLLRQMIKIDKKNYGPDHPKIAFRLNNLAQLLQDTNRPEEAEQLMQQALGIYIRFTRNNGSPHPQMHVAVKNYGYLLQQKGYSEDRILTIFHEMAPELFPGSVTDEP